MFVTLGLRPVKALLCTIETVVLGAALAGLSRPTARPAVAAVAIATRARRLNFIFPPRGLSKMDVKSRHTSQPSLGGQSLPYE